MPKKCLSIDWIKRYRKSGGFALPTVLAASVVMLTVLSVAVSFTVVLRVSLKTQNYSRLMKSANEAGIAYAMACIKSNPSVISKWADNPLTPSTNCDGTELPGIDCDNNLTEPQCAVIIDNDNNIVTSFKVLSATVDINGNINDINSEGTLSLIRSSSKKTTNEKVWKQYSVKGGFTKTELSMSIGWKQVSAGVIQTCAIATNDKAYCWGYNRTWGQLGDGSTIDSYIPIEVSTTGALKDKKILSISSGYSYTCAIADDNLAYCWGGNGNGQLGTGVSTYLYFSPVAVSMTNGLEGKTFKSITSGMYHTCAISSDDKAYCWGYNSYGQLGDGTKNGSNAPISVSGNNILDDKIITSIAIGRMHTCATTSENKLYCWGYNSYGNLGNNSTTESSIPVEITYSGDLNGKTIKSVSIGIYSEHTCAIATDMTLGDQAYCWGDDYYGQIGDGLSGNNVKSLVPKAVFVGDALKDKIIQSISLGRHSTCVIAQGSDKKGLAYCWGWNGVGALGSQPTNINNNIISKPKAVATEEGILKDKTISSISANGNHACVIASDRQMYCWGNVDSSENNYGVLGNNSTLKSFVPVAIVKSSILNDKTIKAVSVGGYGHSCAISNDNLVYCWGRNSHGQLGNNSNVDSRIPVAVFTGSESTPGDLFGKQVKSIAVGRVHDYSCAIASDATLVDRMYCWGNNASGQLGNNSKIKSSVPVKVLSDEGVLSGKMIKSMSLGRDFVCVIATDNKVYCWGDNISGQLGNNTTTSSLVPVQVDDIGVMKDKTIVSISTGTSHACALDSDGNAYCWGDNSSRDLGNVSTTGFSSKIPVEVSNQGLLSGKKIKSISAGEKFTCVIADDDQAYCWGLNDRGQLGNVALLESYIPMKVFADILDGKTIKSISTGTYHSCLIASDGLVYCWGWNNSGQIGNNSIGDVYLPPTRVYNTGAIINKTVKSVSVGLYSNCLIASNDKTYCWGSGSAGGLGNNSINSSFMPEPLFTSLTYMQDYSYTY